MPARGKLRHSHGHGTAYVNAHRYSHMRSIQLRHAYARAFTHGLPERSVFYPHRYPTRHGNERGYTDVRPGEGLRWHPDARTYSYKLFQWSVHYTY